MTHLLRDPDVSARKAAAHAVHLIIAGVSGSCLTILGGDSLKFLYKSLKSCVSTETDDVVLHHCALAIETLDEEVKNTLFPTSSMEKQIYVLDAPPHN